MSWLSRLFGGGSAAALTPEAQPIEYEGYRIYPDPIPEEGQFRLAARIEKDFKGETRTHRLVRADLIRDRDEACRLAEMKARQMIDQTGDRMFG